ncbi:hypothetical protein BH10PLA1_BH10PLA1_17140 [soil metagenome]
MNHRKKHAFTLIELLVVVAIISVLVSMLLPTMYRLRAMARTSVCASNLRQIGIAFAQYRADWHNYLPPVDSFVAHMPTGTDWATSKDYTMINALGSYVGYPEFGGVKDASTAPSPPDDDQYTGYIKSGSYFGPKARGGKKLMKSPFVCPETLSYGDMMSGPMPLNGYGESTYLQKYPSGPKLYNVPSTGGLKGNTSGIGLPRPTSAILNPSMSVAVSERAGDGHSGSAKTLPPVANLTFANYPIADRGGPYSWLAWDMYRHNGGCNILFADGHVSYYKGADIINNIVHDIDSQSMRNYQLP